MKIRTAFVTNSSCSSFILVGVEKCDYINEFAKVFDREMINDHQEFDVFNVVFIGDSEDEVISLTNLDFENMSVKQMRKFFVDRARDCGVKVDPKDVKFRHGVYYG